jgi:hypothetical protein
MPRQDLPLLFIKGTFTPDRLLVFHHHREGFGGTAFSLAKPVDRLFVCGVTAQMKTPDSLDRDDSSRKDHLAGSRNGPASADSCFLPGISIRRIRRKTVLSDRPKSRFRPF